MDFTVKLRVRKFTKAALLAGFSSSYGLAKQMGIHRTTLKRVIEGVVRPGSAFIGGALFALRPMRFEDLFEVVVDREGADPP